MLCGTVLHTNGPIVMYGIEQIIPNITLYYTICIKQYQCKIKYIVLKTYIYRLFTCRFKRIKDNNFRIFKFIM